MDDDGPDLEVVGDVVEGLASIFTTTWGWACILTIAIVVGCFWYLT